MKSKGQPIWNFPLLNGGMDVVQDSASEFFTDDPIAKLVRETIQNSLDAKQDGLAGPVKVAFTDKTIDRDVFDGMTLREHLRACADRVESDKHLDPAIGRFYRKASESLRKRVRVLSIVDSGTTGLRDGKWNALVKQAGAANKQGPAPGGAFGIGKNAVFNLSALRSVIYSTYYLERRKGRKEDIQGKAMLMSHPDPGTRKDVQHVGFLEWPKMRYYSELPDEFRIPETGAGVFILGFDPQTTKDRDWINQVLRAVVENFFYAIHNRKLVVEISARGAGARSVTHETISGFMDSLYRNRKPDAYYYHKGISAEAGPKSISVDKPLGDLDVHMLIEDGAPRRTAYINRMGMLITDSREKSVNPASPRRRALWPDFAAVIVPKTASGDAWSRKMENPSHDAVSTAKLKNPRDRRKAERIFGDARRSVRNMIDEEVGANSHQDKSNITELHDILPDEYDPDRPGNVILVSVDIPTPSNPMPDGMNQEPDGEIVDIGPVDEDDDYDPNPNPDDPDPNPDDPKPDPDDPKPRPRPRRKDRTQIPRATLTAPRFIALGETESVVAFELVKSVDRLNLVLKPAGAEPDRYEPITVTGALMDGKRLECGDDGSVMIPSPPVGRRMKLRLTTVDSIQDRAIVVQGMIQEKK